jgi:hypothetical protein
MALARNTKEPLSVQRDFGPSGGGGSDIEYLRTLSDIISRSGLMRGLGQDTYGGDRDVYTALGYPKTINPEDYRRRYERQDIAQVINDAYPKKCWHKEPRIYEDEDDESSTSFEKQVEELSNRLRLWEKLKRLDILTGLGRFGILFLGFSDASTKEELRQEVGGGGNEGNLELKYIHPYSEKNVKVLRHDRDPTSERYGYPVEYQIKVEGPDNTSDTIIVHHTRVLHVCENLLDGNIYGQPRLKVVYNRLIDLERVVGGSGEMFWRGARPGLMFTKNPNVNWGNNQSTQDLHNQMDAYAHGLNRVIRAIGVEAKSLTPQVEDPTSHVDVQMQMVSAVTRIPKRILTGSERGELASSQDEREWRDNINARREGHCEDNIVRPFIDLLIEYGILSAPKEYALEWPDLWQMGRKEEVEIGKAEATMVKEYANSPAAEVVPVEMFLSEMMRWDDEKVEQAMALLRAQIDDADGGEEDDEGDEE